MFSFLAHSQSFEVDRVRGKAKFVKDGRSLWLKKGLVLEGPGVIVTGQRSYTKISLPKKGKITVGAKSQVAIKEEDPKKPALISILKGRIRAQIYKKKTQEHKLYIQTRSASVGVRGTDFMVIYNDKNHITSNITFSGEVDFHKKSDKDILDSLKEDLDSEGKRNIFDSMELTDLEDQLNGREIVRIKKGEFSGAYPTYDTPIAPTKLSLLQYDALKGNTSEKSKSKNRTAVVYNKVVQRKKFELTNKNLIPEPQGKEVEELLTYNDKVQVSGVSVRPGGVIDLDSGIYVMPPKGSYYDAKSGTYLLPGDYGGIDARSGDYIPPKDVEIDPIQGFVRWEKGVRKQIDKFSKAVTDLLDKYKKVTRVDLSASANYYFSLKSFENYYGEYRNITDSESMTFDFKGFAGRHLYNNKRYLHYIKAGVETILHNRREEPLVQRNDRLVSHYGYEFHRKHRIKGRKASFVLDLDFETVYQDHNNKDQFDFYTESTNLTVSERYATSRRHKTELGVRMSAFQGHEDKNHGNIYKAFWHNTITSNRPYTFQLNFSHSQRQEKKTGDDFSISLAELGATKHDIFRKADLHLFGAFQYHESKKALSIKRARVQQYRLMLSRRKGEYLKFNFFYQYLKQNADGPDKSRSFSQQSFGAGTTFIF